MAIRAFFVQLRLARKQRMLRLAKHRLEGGWDLGNLRHFVPPTPIRLDILRNMLDGYPNVFDADTLQKGFTGFSSSYNGLQVGRNADCLKSTKELPHVALEKIEKEQSLGRISGPFDRCPFPQLQCSPIGLVLKYEPYT